ncbi:MAG: hypothetical protein ACI9VN_000872 [Patescibacteria group bacterium]|jgi:hypothetical protein
MKISHTTMPNILQQILYRMIAWTGLAFLCLFSYNNANAQSLHDVGIINVVCPATEACDLNEEILFVTLANLGLSPESPIPFRYSVNGEDAGVIQPLDGFYTGVLGPDSIVTLEFEMTYDFSADQVYEVLVWTELVTDTTFQNDTFALSIENLVLPIQTTPYINNFDVQTVDWYIDSSISVNTTLAFGVPEGVLINAAATGDSAWVTNLSGDYNPSETSYLTSTCIDFSNYTEDPILSFSINYDTEINWDGAWLEVTLGDGKWDKLGAFGQGTNWYSVENTFTDLGNVWAGNSGGWVIAELPLDGFAGLESARFRFGFDSDGSVQNEGFAIDDIKIIGCLETFDWATELQETSTPTSSDGSITITPGAGVAPYTYLWDNDSTTNIITGLVNGDYTVNVTDANGCQDELTVTLGLGVSANEISELAHINLSPNPTAGQAILKLNFHNPVDFMVAVMNPVGQKVLQFSDSNTSTGLYPLDLSKLPSGVYFVQIMIPGSSTHVERLLVQ